MPTVSVVTCWAANNAPDLANDYFLATQGIHQVVTVDNASAPESESILVEMTEHLHGTYIRNDKNLGFAAGNNQGYAAATGDIILFLNSDIAAPAGWLNALVADVRDGALYGPSLRSQLVAGRHLPYIEGWCIAATKKTWVQLNPEPATRLETSDGIEWYEEDVFQCGPWDADTYPGPYWEDNDLCLRALQNDIQLVHTSWPVQHKGGRTAGPIMAHSASFAANERTFTERVLAALPPFAPTPTWGRYMQQVYTQSDIQHHLGLLYSLARGNVVELGTRDGVSTAALLAGVEAHGGHVTSIDLADCSNLYAGHPAWEFIQSDSRNPELLARVTTPIDCLLIDTEHQIAVTSAELELWAPQMRPGGRILLHDPETFPGVRRAVTDFCAARGWAVTFVLPCNGMAVVEVPN